VYGEGARENEDKIVQIIIEGRGAGEDGYKSLERF